MDAWADYALADLLMFAPDSYRRLFAHANAAAWPLALLLSVLAAWRGWPSRPPGARADAAGWLLLGATWGFVAAWFLYRHYAQIQLAAPAFALAFGVQAVLLAGYALRVARQAGDAPRDAPGAWQPARLLLVYALLVHPLIGVAAGHDWSAIELFAIAPDPTALGTLGLVLLRVGTRPLAWLLVPIPLAWCAVTGLTHVAMGQPLGLLAPLLGVAGVVATLLWGALHRTPPVASR